MIFMYRHIWPATVSTEVATVIIEDNSLPVVRRAMMAQILCAPLCCCHTAGHSDLHVAVGLVKGGTIATLH